jgi:long-subunit fatty acid transport protein
MRIAGRFSLYGSALLLALALPLTAHAGGLELLPGGTASVMRGGANAARPEDATGMLHNPAGLAFMKGGQITFDLDFALTKLCFDPYGYYGWGIYDANRDSDFGDPLAVKLDKSGDPIIGATYATTPLPQVCNSGPTAPSPNVAWVQKFGDDLAFGAGIVSPTLVTGNNFGAHDGTISIHGDAFPSPTRYAFIDQTVVTAFAPSVALAYRVLPQLSLGVNVTLIGLRAKTRVISNATSGTHPGLDWLVDLDAQDFFLPTVVVSAHLRPIRSLDATASLRWVDDFDGHGKVTYETNTFHELSTSGSVPYRNDPIKLSTVRVGLPWAVNVGVRYSGKLAPPAPDDDEEHLGDPLDTELWDVELDGTYNLNERSGDNRVRVGDDIRIVTRTADGGGAVQPVKAKDIEDVSVERHLKDSIALRLGGSFSVAPRKVALNAGVFYENRGVDPAYANIDSFAFARFGFGLGAMFRLGEFDLMAGYGHVFQETLQVATPDDGPEFDKHVGGTFDAGGVRQGGYVLEDPDDPLPSEADAVAALKQSSAIPKQDPPPSIINAGKYTGSFNIISVGAVYHF